MDKNVLPSIIVIECVLHSCSACASYTFSMGPMPNLIYTGCIG